MVGWSRSPLVDAGKVGMKLKMLLIAAFAIACGSTDPDRKGSVGRVQDGEDSGGGAAGSDPGVRNQPPSIELLELVTQIVVELGEEGGVGGVRVWRVVGSWGDVLSVGVLLLSKDHSACEVCLEGLSLLVESSGELASGLGEGSVEGFVVDLDFVIELGLSIDFSLGESVSEVRSESVEVISLHLAESFELLILDIEGFSEGASGLADGLGDGCRLGFKELDEVEHL